MTIEIVVPVLIAVSAIAYLLLSVSVILINKKIREIERKLGKDE